MIKKMMNLKNVSQYVKSHYTIIRIAINPQLITDRKYYKYLSINYY
jgi:hypothetical protein